MGAEGQDTWDDPAHQADLLALAAGVAVRDRHPEHFLAVHRALFDARHVDGADLRSRGVVHAILAGAGADADAVLAEVDAGWPAKVIRQEHERCVEDLDVFGVPTFIVDDDAVFVRLMSRSDGDGALARQTIDRVLALMGDHPELNEFKHTRLSR
jgi:2-hydroxychromene-2-carboxylate isomerase